MSGGAGRPDNLKALSNTEVRKKSSGGTRQTIFQTFVLDYVPRFFRPDWTARQFFQTFVLTMRSDFPARSSHQTIFSDFCVRQSVQIGTDWRESLNRLSNIEVWINPSGETVWRESLSAWSNAKFWKKCLVGQVGRTIWKHCLTRKSEKNRLAEPARQFSRLLC